jgi:hypothetical protein
MHITDDFFLADGLVKGISMVANEKVEKYGKGNKRDKRVQQL